MKKKYDIIIVGGGVAGKSAASKLAASGKKVAAVENDLWGGTCPNRGCDPKKVLVAAVEDQSNANQLIGKGIESAPAVNWPDLMAFKKTFTDPVSEQTKKSLIEAGVDTYSATVEFINENSIRVNDDILEADQFIISTGAHPSILDIEGKEHFLTSDDFLSLPEMPETVTFVGGGYIAFEFAAIANAAGAKVHVIQHNKKPLKAYDQEFIKELMKQLEDKGVTFHLDINITNIQKSSNQFILTDEDNFNLTTDLVFGTTGRIPNIENLKLENAKIQYDKKGIKTNKFLQTSNSAVYAMGDVLSKSQPKLTPVASLEASYLVSFLTGKTEESLIYPEIPTIVFSSPKVAQVGVTPSQADKDKDKYDIATIDATDWFSYARLNEPVSLVKIITEKESGNLVGATCMNNEADVLINLFSILINKKITANELSDIVFAYPTMASDLSSLLA